MKGEIKPFGYALRKFILKRVLKQPDQKRIYSDDEMLFGPLKKH